MTTPTAPDAAGHRSRRTALPRGRSWGGRRSTGPRPGPRPRRSALVVNGLLVLVAAAWLANVGFRSRLLLTNIDGISYMSIARQYAAGEVGDAVNAYWSPMVSWLMAPLVRAGLGLTTAYTVVDVLASVVVLGVGAWLLLRRGGSGWTAGWYVAASTPLLVANVARQTPDVLVLAWFVVFLWVLVVADESWDGTRRRMLLAGVLLGVVCAVGYTIKLFLVPVFLVVVPAWVLLRWVPRVRAHRRDQRAVPAAHRRDQRSVPTADGRDERTVPPGPHHEQGTASRAVLRPLLLPAVAVVALVVVSAPWIAALSLKYGSVTAGSSLVVNTSSKFSAGSDGPGPDYRLPTPPNATAVSPSEDRTPSVFDAATLTARRGDADRASDATADRRERAASADQGAPLVERLGYYLGQRADALPYYFARISSFAPFALLIGTLVGGAAVARLVTLRRYPFAALAGIATGVYWLGYAGIADVETFGGNSRYYLPLATGTVLMAGALLPSLWRTVRGHRIRQALVVAVCAVVVTASVSQNLFDVAQPFSTVKSGPIGAPPFRVTDRAQRPDEPLTRAIGDSGVIPPGSRVAGSNVRSIVSLAFRLDGQALGEVDQEYDIADPAFVRLLQRAHADYWLQFTPEGAAAPDLTGAGAVVASYDLETQCQDVKGAEIEPCHVDVVRLAR